MCDCEIVFVGQNNYMAPHHGMKNTRLYGTWKSMFSRCFSNKRSKKDYKDRGIGICKQWSSFLQFYKDMGNKPSDEYSIDRINNDLGYCPHNCRWATKTEQIRNRGRRKIRSGKNVGLPEGVKAQTKSNTFYSAIRHNKKYYYLGSFKTPQEAHEAYIKKKEELGII